jgi:hypothetical protein
VFCAKKLNEGTIERQMCDVEFDPLGEDRFKSGFAPRKPEWKTKEVKRPMAGEDQQRIVQRIAFDERAIQIYAEGRLDG